MTLTLWLSLVAACLIISLTPGAGAVNTMTTSLLYGWRRSFFTVLGQQLALLTQIAIVAAGLGVIVAQSPILFDVIRYGGAAYLVYLGIRMMLAKVEPAQDAEPARVEGAGRKASKHPGSPLSLVNRGLKCPGFCS